MATFFDEKKLKDKLRSMDENQREQYVNGFLKMVGMGKLQEGNSNLDTAFMHMGCAITSSMTMPSLTQEEREKIDKYLSD